MNRKWNLVNRQNYGVWVLGLSLVVGLAVRGWSQLQPIRAIVAPVDNRLALSRGCRTGGVGGINKIKPEWVSVRRADNPEIAQGVIVRAGLATNDAPNSHFSHDITWHVNLDGFFAGLNSDANEVANGVRLMEMEWDSKFIPIEFWPVPGDRVWMMGRWVFDCGHPPYHTEIHPPIAVAFTRQEPTTFPGDSKPTLTNRTSIYIHGRGGNYSAPVAVRDYEFDIPLPPRPSPRHQVRAQVVDRDEFGRLPFGGPEPIITVPDATRVHVRYPLAAINNPSPDLKFGAVIAAGWTNPLTAIGGTTFRVLRVTFDNIRINDKREGRLSGDGEWRLFLRAGSRWMEVRGLGDVDDGDTVAINRSFFVTVPESGAIPVGIQTDGWEDDCDGRFVKTTIRDPGVQDLQCLINGNDELGFIAHDYTKAENFGIGTHNIASSRGDYNLRYRIEQISVVNPPPVNAPITRG
jgi:hypothetical protein